MNYTAYEILDVPKNADDASIKSAYLSLISHYTPDDAPDEFEKIREAFEKIENKKARSKYFLFHHPIEGLKEFHQVLLQQNNNKKSPTTKKLFTALLSEAIDE